MNEASLVGTWHTIDPVGEGKDYYFRFTEDFRWVSFVEIENARGEMDLLPMRKWYAVEEGSRLTFRDRKGVELRRTFAFVDGLLVIDSLGEGKPRRWICERLTPEQVPVWFDEQFPEVLERSWER